MKDLKTEMRKGGFPFMYFMSLLSKNQPAFQSC